MVAFVDPRIYARVVVLLSLNLFSAYATDCYWTDAGGGHDWTTLGNWKNGVAPSAGDSVFIRQNDLVARGQGPLISAGMEVVVQSLALEPDGGDLCLTMTGGALRCTSDEGVAIRMGVSSNGTGRAVFMMSGGHVYSAGKIQLGYTAAQPAKMVLSGKATVHAESLYMPHSCAFLEINDPAEFHLMPSAASSGNPVMIGADPHAEIFDDTLYIYNTSGGWEHFYAYSSADLKNWELHGPILDLGKVSWLKNQNRGAWAPCIARNNDRYYFYYSAGPKPSHIGVAVGRSPVGPFVDSGKPLISDLNRNDFEAIDPMVFQDPATGVWYLYAGGSNGSTLKVFKLNDEMTGIDSEVEVAPPPHFTEAPFMHYRDGIYYLSYSSGSWCDDSYSVHYATASNPCGPWSYKGAMLTSDAASPGHKGPGHHSIVHNVELDEWYIIYHRWNNRSSKAGAVYSGERETAIDRLRYAGTAILPVVMTDAGIEGITDVHF